MAALHAVAERNGVTLGKSFEDYIKPQIRDYYACDAQIEADGLIITDYRGEMKEHPLIKVRKDCYDRVLAALKAFSLTKKTTNEEETSPLANFLSNG